MSERFGHVYGCSPVDLHFAKTYFKMGLNWVIFPTINTKIALLGALC